jgi:NADH-quinone oxidoreductase subunit F
MTSISPTSSTAGAGPGGGDSAPAPPPRERRPKILTRFLHRDDSHRLDAYRADGGYEVLRRALAGMTAEQIISEVKESGLRGRGGAGFPTGVKWGFIDRKSAKPIYLVVNADESEPGTFKDRLILERMPHLMIEGIVLASYALRVGQAFIYVRGEYSFPAQRISEALAEARAAGLLGTNILGSGWDLEITLYRGAGAYICGEETALLESLEGKKGYPRIKPPFPAVVGLYGCPTVVNNVETLATVPWILEHGSAAYKAIGTEKSTGTRLFCVSGRVRRPGNHEVPLGTPLREFLDEDCGGMREGYRLKGVIPGGASTNVLTPDEVDRAKLDFESMTQFSTFLGSGGVVVIDDSVSIVETAYSIAHFFAHESCGQCSPCREGTGWIARIVHRILAGQGRIEDLDLIAAVAKQMMGTTICPLADADAMPMIAFVTKFRSEWEEFIRSGKRIVEPRPLDGHRDPESLRERIPIAAAPSR